MNQDLEKDIAPQAAGESETNAPPESMALTETSPPPEEEGGLVRNRYADLMNKPKRHLPKPVKIGLTVAIVAGLIAGGVYLVQKTKEKPEEAVESTAFASRCFLETYIEGDGSVAARKQVDLGKDLKGKVTEVLVQPGQAVKTGDKLFVIDPSETRTELDNAKKDLQEAQRAVDEAASGVTAAQKSVSELTTTAPFSGKLLPPEGEEKPKTWRVGDELSGGTTLGLLVDDTTMKLPLYFSYAYIDDIRRGASASVSIPANMSTVSGTVEAVERVEKISADGTRLFRVILSIPNPGVLTKGMVATAQVDTAKGKVMPAETGTLEYSREESVTAKQSGTITRLNGVEYYRFSAGAVIVQQKNDELSRAVETAQRTLTNQKQAIADKQKRIAELEKLIANATVVSPMDGMVLKMDTAVDAELVGGTAPCVVADMSSLVVNAQISMTDINAVQPGQAASITLQDGSNDVALTGTVESVSLQANENQGNGSMPTYTAVIVLDPLPEGVSVSMGYYVSYKITTAQVEDCVIIPTQALVNTAEGTAVFAKPAEGQTFENTIAIPEGVTDIPEGFELVPVTVGISDNTNVEIVDGIEDGTEIFLAGPKDMFDQNSGGELVVG